MTGQSEHLVRMLTAEAEGVVGAGLKMKLAPE